MQMLIIRSSSALEDIHMNNSLYSLSNGTNKCRPLDAKLGAWAKTAVQLWMSYNASLM